eukprot:296485_1
MEFEDQRKKYKNLIFTTFNALISSDDIQKMIAKLSFNNYQFAIGKAEQFEAIMNLLSTEYAKRNPLVKVFNISKDDKTKILANEIKQKLDAGRFIVVTVRRNDQLNSQIVACGCFSDYYDTGTLSKTPEMQKLSLREQHMFEIVEIKSDTLEKLAANKYGQLFQATFLCKNQHIKSSPFLAFFIIFLGMTTMYNCNYKYFYGKAIHPSSDRMSDMMNPIILHENHYSDYTFNDGTHISYYFNQLKKNNNYTDKMIKKLKEACKIKMKLFIKEKTYKTMVNILNNIMSSTESVNMKKEKLSKL